MTIAVRRHLFKALIALSAVTLVSAPAWSLVQPAHAGHAFYPPDPCLYIGGSAVSNTCLDDGHPHYFVIPTATTNNANHTVAARFAGNGSAVTDCSVMALGGNGFNEHGLVGKDVISTTPQVQTLGTVFVASDETLQVECIIAPKLPSGFSGLVVSIGF
jgi:hypothetical protein